MLIVPDITNLIHSHKELLLGPPFWVAQGPFYRYSMITFQYCFESVFY